MAGSSVMSLTLPTDNPSGREVGTSTSPRRAVSPLLEVRRPHCTLNCDHCNAILEDRFKHLSKYFYLDVAYQKRISMFSSTA